MYYAYIILSESMKLLEVKGALHGFIDQITRPSPTHYYVEYSASANEIKIMDDKGRYCIVRSFVKHHDRIVDIIVYFPQFNIKIVADNYCSESKPVEAYIEYKNQRFDGIKLPNREISAEDLVTHILLAIAKYIVFMKNDC